MSRFARSPKTSAWHDKTRRSAERALRGSRAALCAWRFRRVFVNAMAFETVSKTRRGRDAPSFPLPARLTARKKRLPFRRHASIFCAKHTQNTLRTYRGIYKHVRSVRERVFALQTFRKKNNSRSPPFVRVTLETLFSYAYLYVLFFFFTEELKPTAERNHTSANVIIQLFVLVLNVCSDASAQLFPRHARVHA